MNTPKICLLGGDTRQLALARYLSAGGYECAVWGLPICAADTETDTTCPPFEGVICDTPTCAISGSKAIILPLPASADGVRVHTPLCENDPYLPHRELRLTELMEMLPRQALLLAGMPDTMLQTMARDSNVRLIDYYDCEEVPIKNAVPTAEGALAIAMRELPISIFDAHCTILGYGRIGKRLAAVLRALGAQVTVAARSEKDLCWAKLDGITPYPLQKFLLEPGKPDILFNTVPAPILDSNFLTRLPIGTKIVELASAPGCIDVNAKKTCRQKIIRAPSLPGKVAPHSAGRILYETIHRILIQEGVGIT